ncbi:MAG TPA: hypothetical protein P5571_13125 [Candidatus Krumholzibacteria bacterium]|nr:hypothetical protein [Candidatus Krumholzibacteria bacterium]HRX52304.1 hypothetical protein [Candidatus Krumholzibacteria bacterium]
MARAPRFTPPAAPFRARLSAWVLVLLVLATGAAETAHLALADHHAADPCPRPATAATESARLAAPHHHGCVDHHTLADHDARELLPRAPDHSPPPAVFLAPVAFAPPAAGARLEQPGPRLRPDDHAHRLRLIRGPPSPSTV